MIKNYEMELKPNKTTDAEKGLEDATNYDDMDPEMMTKEMKKAKRIADKIKSTNLAKGESIRKA